MIYDCAIIGTGPAGLSAALNLKIRKKSYLWIGSKSLSEKVVRAERISNYPGFVNVSGSDLAEAFHRQISEMDLEITEQMVNSILPFSDHYALMAGSEFYEAKTIILTTGIARNAMLPGEAEYLGKGVSYCATCDGGLYHGRTIAVLCGNQRFEPEIKYLADIAGKVYCRREYKGDFSLSDSVVPIDRKVSAILGEKRVNGIQTENGEVISVDGVFILRDSVAMSHLLPKLAMEDGHISVNRQMETNLPNVFAAGDCTGRPYQYTKAVGEGNVAAHSVLEALSKSENGK